MNMPVLSMTFIAATSMLLLSCTSTRVAQAEPAKAITAPVTRIIVKPHAPTDEKGLMQRVRQKLSHPERVAYLRAMSGDAHVLVVVEPATNDSIRSLLDELFKTGLFEYVELDRLKTIRNGSP